MKNTHKSYEEFINILREKIPQNSVLVKTIADILLIEKAAVYRRLNGTVPFTFSEVAVICNSLGISIDKITHVPSDKNKLFQMKCHNFFNLSESDYLSLENYNRLLEANKDAPNTEFAECSHMFPLSIYLHFQHLTKYYLFKWSYQNQSDPVKPFREISIPKRLSGIYKDFLEQTKHVSFTFFMWDHHIFQHLVTEINYYNDIGLITKTEVQKIKEDLFGLLDHIRDLCMKGGYEETGNYVYIYLSDVCHETICSYLDIPDSKVSMFKFFTLDYIISMDNEVFVILKKWIKSLLRTSTVISLSNEKLRISFLDQQYKIINSL